jgi:hypothetical protein
MESLGLGGEQFYLLLSDSQTTRARRSQSVLTKQLTPSLMVGQGLRVSFHGRSSQGIFKSFEDWCPGFSVCLKLLCAEVER